MKPTTVNNSQQLLAGFIFLLCSTLSAQHMQIIQKDNFVQQSVVELPLSPGQYIVAGTVLPGQVGGNSDILVVKTDNAGTIFWSRYIDFNRDQDEFAGSLTIDEDNHIIITGYTGINGSQTPPKNLLIARLNTMGNLLGSAVIQDAEFNYGLYGLDIKALNDQQGFIVAGLGTDSATANADKFAFVLRISFDLTDIEWGRRYQSYLGLPPFANTTQFDSFNHILKVDHPTFGEAYLLTGSGADGFNNMQMVTNDLIDPNTGMSVWNLSYAQGNRAVMSIYDNPGVMALYRQSVDTFYVLFHGVENMPSLLLLNGTSGASDLNYWPNHNHTAIGDFNNILTGMVWSDTSQTEIVFSGYHIESGYYPPLDTAYPILVKADITPVPGASQWYYYNSLFNAQDFVNINFDYIAQPINMTDTSYPFVLNQHYYKPKGLVKNSVTGGYTFTVPYQSATGAPFGLNLIKTASSGQLPDGSCWDDTSGLHTQQTRTKLLNFGSTDHHFEIIDQLQAYSANVNTFIQCAMPAPKPLLRRNTGLQPSGIIAYPNPASDFITIAGLPKSNHIHIEIIDLQGRQIQNYVTLPNKENLKLNVSALPGGIYFMYIYKGVKNIFRQKVVVIQ